MRESSVSELWDKGDFDAVEKVAKEILAQHPNQVDALYFLGKVLASRGENEMAISLWEKVQRNEPMLSKNMEDLIHSARQRDAT